MNSPGAQIAPGFFLLCQHQIRDLQVAPFAQSNKNFECLSNATIPKWLLMLLNNVITFACIWEAVWYSHDCCAAAAIYSTLLSKMLCLNLNLICRYRELFLHPTSAKPIKVEGQVGRYAWLSVINRGDWHRYRELGLLLCWNHIREYCWLSLKSCKGMYLFPIIMSNYARIFHVTHVIQ